ncbi:MAG TPA: phosphoenolpyruvate--protein phosphotransferase [Polyangiaceae bacterium]|nr:phosphoenolpyruvate--protein phosphotransferase [Polyangiaceae bacterium]
MSGGGGRGGPPRPPPSPPPSRSPVAPLPPESGPRITPLPPAPRSSVPPPPSTLRGLGGSPGVAVGPALVVAPRRLQFARRLVRSYEVDGELERVRAAVGRAQGELREMSERAGGRLSGAEQNILEAYVLMLGDELLAESVERNVRLNRQCAEWAVASAIEEMAASLASAADAYLRERSHDIEFVGERLLIALTGDRRPALPRSDEPAVVVAHDLSPADLLAASERPLKGLATEAGTRTSHTAIVARALGIPAVVGVEGLMAQVASGETLVVDGLRGTVTVRPTDEVSARSRARGERHRAFALRLLGDAARPAELACGERVRLYANIELASEAPCAVEHGAEGVGLYRTEFLYLDRERPPSEDEQFEHYRTALEGAGGRPVTFRTFDIGADKVPAPASSLALLPERNPALGTRAVRLGLLRPELFLAQLRALWRASAHGPLRVMVPMVSSLREWAEVKALFRRAAEEVDRAGQARAADVPLGAMIEVPAAAILADLFAAECAFLSLGTNDLVQYTLAVDRLSPLLAHLASHFDPAVLRLVRGVAAAAERSGRPLTACGTMASDPLGALLLVGLGLRGLSMEPGAIPEIKEALGRVRLEEARAVAQRALECASAGEVEEAMAVALGPRLYDLMNVEDTVA